jgi:dihydroneopterin aldolase
LFADREAVLDLRDLIASEWYGVMLDTAGKAGRSLPQLLENDVLKRFVSDARGGGMHCGFAGGLGADAVAELLELDPDQIGFRGALCEGNDRRQALDAEKVAALRALIPPDPRATRLRHKTSFRSTRPGGR